MKAGTLEIEIVAEIARLQQDLADVKRAIKGVDDAVRPANDNFNKFGKGAQQAGASSKLASHQVQNLAYQFNDLFVSLASGQKPMTVFMQQGSQIGQIMAQARIGVGGLAKEVGGMVGNFAKAHPILTAVAAAAAASAGAMTLLTREVNAERKAELDAYVASLGLTKEEIAKLGPVSITAGDAMRGLWAVIKEGLGLEKVFTVLKNTVVTVFNAMLTAGKYAGAGIYAALAGSVDGTILVFKSLPGIVGEAAANAANAAIAAVERMINKALAGMNAMITLINGAFSTSIQSFGPVNLGRVENQWAGAGKAAANGVIAGYSKRFNEGLGAFDAAGKRLSDAMVDAAKDRLGAKAGEIIDDRSGGKIKDKAGKTGKDAGDKFAEQFLKGYYEGIADLIDGNEAFWKQWEKDVTTAWKNLGDTFKENAKVATDYTTDWNEELRKTVDLLDRMGSGKLGNIGAAIVGLTSGDFSGVRGKGGALLQMLGGMSWQNGQGQTVLLREEIVKGLDKVFGDTGSFAKTMSGLLQGAGTGLAIGSALYPGNKTAQTVGAIAGAMANAAGTAVGGPAAGAAASVVASTIWSSIAKAFTATKKGVATFDGSGLVSTRGNSKSRIAGATSAGNSAIDALAQIADAFGADIGDASFSLGIRKKNYVLDPTGQGRTKGAGVLNFGQDSEAAIKAAIKDAISDGVFEGLSAGVERLLKGEGDIEKQLKKALDFQGVFDELSQRNDPTGFGLGQLDKQFGKLRDIFAEAGASTEEYAKLEELFQLKRTEIINEGSRRSRELEIEIMRLTGDGIGALNAERAMEKEGLSDVLVAQIDRRNALIDEAIATEQARVVAEERRQLEYRMAQALGDEEKILTMRREDDLAVTSELNKVYLQQVQAAEAAAAAVAKAAAAQNAAVSSLQGLPGMIGGGVLGAAGNPAVLGALGMFAGGDVTGARNALASYISNTVGTALPGATSAVQSAAIDQVIASLSPSGPVNIGRGVTTGQLGGNKKPAGNLSDGKLAQRYADAEAARVDKLDDLHSRLADAYDREKKALEDLVEPFRKVREELIAYKEDLLGGMRSPGQTLQSLQVKLMAAAASKDASVLATIPGLGRDFDSLARSRSSTKADYMRQQAFLVGIVDQAIGTAGGQVNYNEEQLQRLDKSVDLQIEIKKEQETTNDLLRQLLDENKGERSEQLQLGLKIEQWTHGTHKALRGATRGGNTMEVELDA